MGNNNVYGEGRFITPNKILKPTSKVDENALNIENVFGKVEIPASRVHVAGSSPLGFSSQINKDVQIDCKRSNA